MFIKNFSKEIILLTVLFVIVFAVAVFMHYADYTFLSASALGRYPPWRDYVDSGSCFSHSGDDLYENDFIASELSYLSSNLHQQTYSERIMNGYPISDSYLANKYTVFNFFNNFLPPPSSINFSALLMIFISFVLGYFIARSLGFNYYYSALLGVLSTTVQYTSLFEAWSAVLIGYGCVILGCILFYKYDRLYPFVILSLIGSLLIFLSSIYQFYLYTAINFIFLGLFYFALAHKKKFFTLLISLIIIFIASTMLINFSLINHYDFLSSSQKASHEVGLSEVIKKKHLAIDPVTWVWGGIAVHHKVIKKYFLADESELIKFISNRGVQAQGVAYVLLMGIGLYLLFGKAKPYILIIVFWVLYSMGIINLALAVVVGDPFHSESSLASPLLVFILGSFAVIYALRELLNRRIQLSHRAKIVTFFAIGGLLFASGSMLFWDMIVHSRILPGVMIAFASAIIMLFAVRDFASGGTMISSRKKLLFSLLLAVVLVLPTGAKMFTCFKPSALLITNSKFYYPKTKFEEAIKEEPGLERVAMIRTPSNVNNLHANLPVRLGVSTITGYRNTIYKDYFDLYNYHRILVETNSTSSSSQEIEDLFRDFKKTVLYLSNQLLALKTSTSSVLLSPASERYFSLHGVNGVIGLDDLNIENENWEKVSAKEGLSLWKDKRNPAELFFATESVVIPDEILRMKYVLENPNFDIYNQVVLSKGIGVNYNTSTTVTSQFEILEKTDGYRLINADVKTEGILSLPVTYSKNWKARWRFSDGVTEDLITQKANHVFLGVELQPGQGLIELVYNDKPKLLNSIIAWAGVVLLVLLVLGLKRFLARKTNEGIA